MYHHVITITFLKLAYIYSFIFNAIGQILILVASNEYRSFGDFEIILYNPEEF